MNPGAFVASHSIGMFLGLLTSSLTPVSSQFQWITQIADGFKLGSGNSCPAGYSKLTSLQACLAALDKADTTADGDSDPNKPDDISPFESERFHPAWYSLWGVAYGIENTSMAPSGCVVCDPTQGCELGADLAGWYWNSHATGGDAVGVFPLCKRGTDPLIVKGRTLFLGDSTFDYWKSASATFAPAYNIGVSGYRCEQIVQQIDEIIAAFLPSTVVLLCGSNDIAPVEWGGAGKTPEEAFAFWQSIVDKVMASGARVVSLGTFPEPATAAEPGYHEQVYMPFDKLVQRYARSIAARVTSNQDVQLSVVKTFESFQTMDNLDTLWVTDFAHFNQAGYTQLEAMVAPALAEASPRTCLMWTKGACAISTTPQRVTVTCGSLKTNYKDMKCCGSTEQRCINLKNRYQSNNCCGNPAKEVPDMR